MGGLDPGATYTVTIENGGVNYSKTFYTDDDPLTFQRVDFSFTGSVSGDVSVLKNGSEVPGDGIELKLIHDGQLVRETTTNRTGFYDFENALTGTGYKVKVAGEPYRMTATAERGGSGTDFTVFRSSPIEIKQRQTFIKSGSGESDFIIQEFLMFDQKSLIANSEIESFEDGVAVVDLVIEQELPRGTSGAFIAPMMGQGVKEETILNATVDNETAILRARNLTIDLSAGEQDFGATYKVDSDAEGLLGREMTFSKGINYYTGSAMVVNRISDGDGRYGVQLELLDVEGSVSTNRYGNYLLSDLDEGDVVRGRISWDTYSRSDMITGAGAFAALVLGALLVTWYRRRS